MGFAKRLGIRRKSMYAKGEDFGGRGMLRMLGDRFIRCKLLGARFKVWGLGGMAGHPSSWSSENREAGLLGAEACWLSGAEQSSTKPIHTSF